MMKGREMKDKWAVVHKIRQSVNFTNSIFDSDYKFLSYLNIFLEVFEKLSGVAQSIGVSFSWAAKLSASANGLLQRANNCTYSKNVDDNWKAIFNESAKYCKYGNLPQRTFPRFGNQLIKMQATKLHSTQISSLHIFRNICISF